MGARLTIVSSLQRLDLANHYLAVPAPQSRSVGTYPPPSRLNNPANLGIRTAATRCPSGSIRSLSSEIRPFYIELQTLLVLTFGFLYILTFIPFWTYSYSPIIIYLYSTFPNLALSNPPTPDGRSALPPQSPRQSCHLSPQVCNPHAVTLSKFRVFLLFRLNPLFRGLGIFILTPE